MQAKAVRPRTAMTSRLVPTITRDGVRPRSRQRLRECAYEGFVEAISASALMRSNPSISER